MRLVAAWCMVVLLTLAADAGMAADTVSRVVMDGKEIPFQSTVFDGRPFLALSQFSLLHAAAVYDPEHAQAIIKLGGHTAQLTAGSDTVVFDGQPVAAVSIPRQGQNEFWVPADLLKLFSLTTSWDAGTGTLSLAWARPFFLGARLLETGGKASLVLEAAAVMDANVFVLKEPDRLVIDFQGLEPYTSVDLDDRPNGYFSSLRCGMNKPGVMRFVADLKQPIDYRVDESRAGEGILCVDFDALITGVSIEPAEEGNKIAIMSNVSCPFKVVSSGGTGQVAVEFSGAELSIPPGSGAGSEGDWFRGFTWEAVSRGTVRVTVDLSNPMEYEISRSSTEENVVEVQPLRSMGQLTWTDPGSAFDIKSSGVVDLQPKLEHDPEKLVFSVLHASAAQESGAFDRGPVSLYQVRQISPGLVEIELDLRYDTSYSVSYSPDKHQATVRLQSAPLQGLVIVLDPGHGGEDPGAIDAKTLFTAPDGTQFTLREKDINLDVSLRLKDLLEQAGASVYLTRVDDTYVPLYARASFANRLPARIFISIHTNAAGDPAVHGAEAYYYKDRDEDQRLARLILEEMENTLDLVPRRGTYNDLAVLRESQIISVLVELGFLTNPDEEARLATQDFRQRAAEAVCRAVIRFTEGETCQETAAE